MAFDAFIKFTPDAGGEATQVGHVGWTEIFSFSLGGSNPVTVGAGTTGLSGGKVSLSSFNLMKRTDKASPNLFSAMCQGLHYKTAIVELSKTTGAKKTEVFIKYTFTDVMVESIQWSGSSGGDDTPTESVSLAFAKIEISYKPQKDDGTLGTEVKANWDLQAVQSS